MPSPWGQLCLEPKKCIPQSRGRVAGVSVEWGCELFEVEVKNRNLLFIFRGWARPQTVLRFDVNPSPFEGRGHFARCRRLRSCSLFCTKKHLRVLVFQNFQGGSPRTSSSFFDRKCEAKGKRTPKTTGLQPALGDFRVAGLSCNNQFRFPLFFSPLPSGCALYTVYYNACIVLSLIHHVFS